MDDSLEERVSFTDRQSCRFSDPDIDIFGKLVCKSCGGNLGVICKYKMLEFPVPKIDNFLIVDINGRQDTCKKWKTAPFYVESLLNDDLRRKIQSRCPEVDL